MPKTKAPKKAETSDSDSGPDDKAPVKKSKSNSGDSKPAASSGGGDKLSWDLGKNKFVNLSEYKGKWYVGIREFYMNSDGDLKPGKKGIMLTMEQWQKFKDVIPDVEEGVKKNC